MIFLTVGTQFPFDRLVQALDDIVDQSLIDEEIFAQIGESSYKPRNFESVASLGKRMFDKYVKKASAIISHAGIGIITIALENEKPLLVMPRLKKYGEVVNDHQVTITKKFEKLGHVLAAYGVKELPRKIKQLSTFVPKARESQIHFVVQRISEFLNELTIGKQGKHGTVL